MEEKAFCEEIGTYLRVFDKEKVESTDKMMKVFKSAKEKIESYGFTTKYELIKFGVCSRSRPVPTLSVYHGIIVATYTEFGLRPFICDKNFLSTMDNPGDLDLLLKDLKEKTKHFNVKVGERLTELDRERAQAIKQWDDARDLVTNTRKSLLEVYQKAWFVRNYFCEPGKLIFKLEEELVKTKMDVEMFEIKLNVIAAEQKKLEPELESKTI